MMGDIRSSVVRVSEFKSEDPGFDPLFDPLSLPVNSCADLFVLDPHSCLQHAPHPNLS